MRDEPFDSAGKTDRLRFTAPTAAGAAVLQLAEGARRVREKKPATSRSPAGASATSDTLVPFLRAAPAIPKPSPPAVAPATILVAPPVSTSVPDFARQVVADVVARGAREKNVPLAPDETDPVVNTVLAALDLADLYRLAMGESVAVRKAAQLIGDTLDAVAVQRIMLFVREIENKENTDDPVVIDTVTGVVKEIALARASGPIIWPGSWREISEAVTKYYGSRPSMLVKELPDGLTATSHWLHGHLHRDEQDGPAVIVHVIETGALRREAYYYEGELHRDAGPAEIFHAPDGTVTVCWYRHGKLHRNAEDGPAMTVRDAGTGALLREAYFHDGALHRDAGPADTYHDPELGMIDEYWCHRGKLHRDPTAGPARLYRDAVRSWSEYYVDDVCHRPASEGPAFVFSHSNGQEISGEEYIEHGVQHRPPAEGPAWRRFDRAGNTVLEVWCERGLRHRDAKDGPAFRGIENGRRIEEYCRHDRLHRDEADGPAVIEHDAETGTLLREAYFHEGESHRESGPAETCHDPDGRVSEHWYRHGLPHRDGKDGPAFINRSADGTMLYEAWYRQGDLHRTSRHGPAHRWCCPDTGRMHEEYYDNCKLHRDAKEGPAVIVRDAAGAIVEQEFWVNGEQVDALAIVESTL